MNVAGSRRFGGAGTLGCAALRRDAANAANVGTSVQRPRRQSAGAPNVALLRGPRARVELLPLSVLGRTSQLRRLRSLACALGLLRAHPSDFSEGRRLCAVTRAVGLSAGRRAEAGGRRGRCSDSCRAHGVRSKEGVALPGRPPRAPVASASDLLATACGLTGCVGGRHDRAYLGRATGRRRDGTLLQDHRTL